MARKRARTTGHYRRKRRGMQTVRLGKWAAEDEPYHPLAEERPQCQGKDPMALLYGRRPTTRRNDGC